MNSVYEIRDIIDLNGQSMNLASYSVLRIIGGRISNGTICGDHTFLEVISDQPVFSNITLTGIWKGRCDADYFEYNNQYVASGCQDFLPIFKNLLRFETIHLSRKEYFLQWDSFYVSGNHSIDIYGHGATFYISSNKGAIIQTNPWGASYEKYFLLDFSEHPREQFIIRDLIIEDNASTSKYHKQDDQDDPDNQEEPYQDQYGEEKVYSIHTVYSLFVGLATQLTQFINVKYDGGGQFHKSYNHTIKSDRLFFSNCDLHSNGFVVEIQCERQTELGSDHYGSLNCVMFDNCIIHNHFSRFVGPLSLGGEIGQKQLIISNSKFCGYRGNLEVFGSEKIRIYNTVFVNVCLCSEHSFDRPNIILCSNSHFFLTDSFNNESAYKIQGTWVYLENNHFYISEYLLFANIDRLFFYNNSIVCPKPNDYIFVTDQSVRIGYYANNCVSSPRVYDKRIRLRLDKSFVTAQSEPFRIAFRNDSEENLYCYTFSAHSGFISVDQLPGISVNSDGYAVTQGETATLTPISPVNSTITISLVGRLFSDNDTHPILSLPISNRTISILQNYGSMYSVFVDNNEIARVMGQDYNGEQHDVRLDVTITQINGHFELFVFVNQELFAKFQENALDSFSPGTLTFSPNSSTGIKQLRYVAGGNIVDDYQTLLTDVFNE